MSKLDEGDHLKSIPYLLGEFVISLSAVDLGMSRLLCAITGLKEDVGRAIYYAHDNPAQRRKLVIAAAEIILIDPGLKAAFDSIAKEHAKIYDKRNRLMHDLWLRQGTGAFVHGQTEAIDEFNKADAEQLRHLTERAQILMGDALRLSFAVPKP